MTIYHSDKIDELELLGFKQNVLDWLNKNFDISGFKVRVYNCYGGDVRLYNGEKMEVPNNKSSFRRTEARRDDDGNIIGWNGYRGIFKRTYSEYIAINKDEFDEIKKAWETKSEKDNFYWWNDLLFSKLKIKQSIDKKS
jgi:hypothetical protein